MSTYTGLSWHLLILAFIAFTRSSGEEVKCGKRYIDLINPAEATTPSIYEYEYEFEEAKRIVGGHEANHGAFPWQVKIVEKGEEKASHYCGGVVLSEYWVLTAAHCFFENVEYTIIVGDFNETEPDEGEQEFATERFIRHESYTKFKDESLDYDIALIKVSPVDGHGILFNQYVQPACLPDPSIQTDDGVMCAASGWGAEKHEGEVTEVLRFVHLPILNQKTCLETYDSDAPYTDRMNCAGYKDGGVDTCQGDSGGPLVCNYNDEYTVFGITSWGPECGTGLGYYASVRFFVPWIKKNMNLAFSD